MYKEFETKPIGQEQITNPWERTDWGGIYLQLNTLELSRLFLDLDEVVKTGRLEQEDVTCMEYVARSQKDMPVENTIYYAYLLKESQYNWVSEELRYRRNLYNSILAY